MYIISLNDNSQIRKMLPNNAVQFASSIIITKRDTYFLSMTECKNISHKCNMDPIKSAIHPTSSGRLDTCHYIERCNLSESSSQRNSFNAHYAVD